MYLTSRPVTLRRFPTLYSAYVNFSLVFLYRLFYYFTAFTHLARSPSLHSLCSLGFALRRFAGFAWLRVVAYACRRQRGLCCSLSGLLLVTSLLVKFCFPRCQRRCCHYFSATLRWFFFSVFNYFCVFCFVPPLATLL